MILIGAIVSVIVVLAAQTQRVSSNVTVTYVVDGVAAKVSATYATVPTDGVPAKVAMGTGLTFNVEDAETTGELNQGDSVKLTSGERQIVYEYKFTNLANAAFSITLAETPTDITNMDIGYKVSATEIAEEEYKTTVFELGSLLPQAIFPSPNVSERL